ncbi:Macrophage activating glycoprotein [Pseudozyma hubeiensis]|nr:Macrophage activating glycoprotein [Pseudozyma hubeiensis]
MTRIALSVALVSALLASSVSAQQPTGTGNGPDPRATTDLNRNQPTKTWSQWQPKATYALSELPDQYMGSNRIPSGEGGTPGGEPQSGYNTCARNTWNQDSRCQTAYLNSLEDFCLWGPAEYGTVGERERQGVAYCTTDRHGTRLIPDGTIQGAHFVRTRDYVQVTGVGDFTSILIPEGDDGGEFDPHGADDLGNPIGGILYTTANPASNGEPFFISEWTNFMSYNQFCIRACWGERADQQCEHIYDVMGCRWNIPANYEPGVFETCDGDIGQLAGIYGSSTFSQGDPVTPSAHPAPSSSQCSTVRTISHGLLAVGQSASTSSAAASSTASSASSSAAASSMSRVTTGSGAASTGVGSGTSSGSGSSGSSANTQNNAASGATSLTVSFGLAGLVAIGAAAFAL